ncbi:MAG TPA: polysaccharide deacetylase family protein [Acidobacteriota bacterium]|nr:polysaccharide deacetylase family protein [Acidobacteriota bacterium]
MSGLVKNIVTHLAFYLKIWKLCFCVCRLRTRQKLLVVFTFHRITDTESSRRHYLNYDRGLDDRVFETQLGRLCKYFKVIDLDEFLAVISGEKQLREHSALLTFDDGDSDFVKYALPVLRRHGCPSVMFVPTAFVDTDRHFWHLRVSNSLHNMGPDGWSALQGDIDGFPERVREIVRHSSLSSEKEKRRTCQQLVDTLDSLDCDTINGVISALERHDGGEYTLGIRCMGWAELRALLAEGVRIQSHGVSHRKLTQLSAREAERELVDSKTELETRLGRSIETVCYPANSFDGDMVGLVVNAGYRAGFTGRPGTCRYPMDAAGRCQIPRLSIWGANKFDVDLYLGKIAIQRILHRLS